MVRRSSSSSSSSIAVVTVAAMAVLALCLHAAAAYPASMERVLGDNNNSYLPIRNMPSRDLERFIGPCEDCVAAPSAAKRDYSLDRLEPGHLMAGKRDGADRSPQRWSPSAPLQSPFEGLRDTVDRLGSGGPLSARRRPSGRADYVRLQHHRWADFVRRFADDRDSFYYFGDDCVQGGCASPSFYE